MSYPLEQLIQLQQSGQLDVARALCNEALDETNFQDAELLHHSGLLAAQMQNLSLAQTHLEQAIALDNNTAIYHNHLGNVYRLQKDYEKAQAAYGAALRIHPNYPEAHNNLGNIFYRQGDMTQALQHYEKAIRIFPHYGDAHFNCGNCYSHEERYLEAEKHYARAAELQPNNHLIHFNLGLCQRHSRKFDDSVKSFWAYINLQPDDPEGYYYLALSYNEAGNLNEAATAYHKLLELVPEHSEAIHNLAVIYHKQGEHEQAIAGYEKSLSLNPNNDAAKFMCHALKQDAAPKQAPDSYIEFLFDQYASNYDQHLCEHLQYQAPKVIYQLLNKKLKLKDNSIDVLDLGCGTGLMGRMLAPFVKHMTGVDLSEQMLQMASAHSCYESLIKSDIGAYLAHDHEQQFDLITAADVLIYIGDVSDIFKGCAKRLTPGGHFIFTAEMAEDKVEDFALLQSGRYAHTKKYLQTKLTEAGFKILSLKPTVTRQQDGVDVKAWLGFCRVL